MSINANSSVLIVEDDVIQAEMLAAYFRAEKYKIIVHAEDGLDAKAALVEHRARFDLIVCDVNMPHLDGVEFANYLKEIRFAGRFLYISGSTNAVSKMADTLGRVHLQKYLGLIQKPLNPTKLDHFLYGGGKALAASR